MRTVVENVYTYFVLGSFLVTLDLVRRRRDRMRLSLAVYVGALLAKQTVSSPGAIQILDTGIGPGASKLLQNYLILVGLYVLMRFFLNDTGASRRARWELAPMVGVGVGMTVAMLSVTPASRPVIFEKADSVGALAFAVLGDGYIAYALVVSLIAARRCAQNARQRRARIGLGVTAIGLVGAVGFAPIERLASVLTRFYGGQVPRSVEHALYYVATLATIMVVVGFAVSGLTRRTTNWREHRRVLLGLRLLAELLDPVTSDTPWRSPATLPASDLGERLTPWLMRHRYHQRKIACRDGLNQIATSVDGEEAADSPAGQAIQLRDAVERRAAGRPPGGARAVLAAPGWCGAASEDEALLLLARAVEAAAAHRPVSTPITD